jgi:Polysaccharide deacetylase.
MRYLLKKLYYVFLKISKCIGLFEISKLITSKKLRIVCYHNFSSNCDIISWRPELHITPETFIKRIEYINRSNYCILQLDDAVRFLKNRTYNCNLPIVITIDDGWSSILKLAHKIFREHSVVYTVYLTSWYCKNNNPIFNLAVPFVLWKAEKSGFELKKINLPVKINDDKLYNHDDLSKVITNYANENLSIGERKNLLADICSQVMFDYDDLCKNKELSLVDCSELKCLVNDGVDIQLHTHTHKWPYDEDAADLEISKNRLFIEDMTRKHPDHFCYPSGVWDKVQFKFLDKNKIKSAVTCDAGLNDYNTNMYALHRLLDSENKQQIVFEAELSGFIFILNKIGIFKIAKLMQIK